VTAELLDNQRLHLLPVHYGTEIFRCQVGSGVHGVTVDGQDDRDEMGWCIERPEFVIGLDRFEQWIYRTQPDGARSGYGDLDLTVYSLRKWMRLALAGNPTVLIPLFVPAAEVVITSPLAEQLRAQSARFVSRQVASRFLGYMTSQREQMMGLRGKKHTNRPELVERYGYDTKFAYHMCRLGLQGIELLTTGRITLPIPEAHRVHLREIREGKHSRDSTLTWAGNLEQRLADLKQSADVPDRPDHVWANQFLRDAYLTSWGRLETGS
jgi:hypothetical protein